MRLCFFNWESIPSVYHIQSRQKLLNYSDVFISNFSAPICNCKDSTSKCNIVSGDEKREFHFETRVLDTVTISSLNQKEKKTEFLRRDGRMKTTITTNEAVSKPLTLIADLYCFNLLVFYSQCTLFMLFIHIFHFFIYLYLYKKLHYYFVNIHIYRHTPFTQRYQY